MRQPMPLTSHPEALAHRPPADPFAAEASWRRWADALPDICLWLDPHSGRIVDCNRALFGTLGYTRHEVHGWPLEAFAEPRHLERSASTWDRLSRGDALCDANCTVLTRDGQERAVSASASTMTDADGRRVACLVVWRDITARRERELSLHARKRQLKSLACELVDIDLREADLSGQRLRARVLAPLSQVQSRLSQPGRLDGAAIAEVDRLVGLAMLAAGREADLLSPPDAADDDGLQGAIERVTRGMGLEGQGLTRLEGRLPPGLNLPAPSRPVLLRVLQQLVLNAHRHAQARQIWVRLQLDGDRLHVLVGDDGIGFDVAAALAAGDDGAASGLAAAEARMHAIGGRLVLQSRPGRGTRAVATVPLTDPERETTR
jgi:PAS domain S-box-containing protein